ncbi:bifunctional diguanylate cyclase/phosphodiesterase [Neobacillus pocheonensis]|uniref:Bifunctional diguanylate cyclase/phosphodiesterase n=1 Tax=Neobacillus pocheonensis TaxID=363869 RepID=A0ABT0WFW9_9BACI|nr:bifunctional diguanylate cyclase/phosphodiesterase [Neobacillus pocheonensis]
MFNYTGNNNDQIELQSAELLYERLQLTLAFSKRYRMSTAVCYLKLHFPFEKLIFNKDFEKARSLINMIMTRLNSSIRDIDSAIRINSSEFVLLLADVTEDDCKMICERIINAISDTYQIEFNHYLISCNIGICMFPYGAEDPEELIALSKAQMYESETIGNNHFIIFKGDLNQNSYRKVIIENDLPYALRKGQLYVEYQPQFQVKNSKIKGVESLIRWNHPSLGQVSPNEFIPFAEASGVMNDLFFWLLKEICKLNDETLDLTYSINLSVNQLLLNGFVQDVSNIVNKYSVPAKSITLEITENIEIYTLKEVENILHSLKNIGFNIALDDFGNGYFSFSNFIALPIDFIKLDRDFVSSLINNKKHKHVISPIITMAHNLGLEVIIEGIEDDYQFFDWRNLGCDIIQGYYISKPISYDQLQKSICDIELKVNSFKEK